MGTPDDLLEPDLPRGELRGAAGASTAASTVADPVPGAAPVTEASPVALAPRVLLVHDRYREAGGEDVVFDTETALLARHGHQVERLVVDNDDIDTEAGLAGQIRLAANTVWSRSSAHRIREVVRAFQPSVVHVHNTFPLLSPAVHSAARADGAATVQTLHNYRLVCLSANLYRGGRPCSDCVGRLVALPGVVHGCYRDSRAASLAVAAMQTVHRARRTWSRDVDAIIALTAFERDRLIEGGLPAGRLVVRPNFVEVEAPPDVGPGTGFVFAGRLTEDKGVDILLDAWRQARIDSTLTIMGAGPLEPLVLAASAELSNIRFLGVLPRQDLLEVMARSRAVIAPSRWYEGFPLTVLEAFACRRPVIAAGHGSLSEVVTDGQNGLTFRPSDAAHLADRLRWADANAEATATLGKAARATYEAKYTPQRGYETLVAVYRRAIAVRHRPEGR